MARLAVLGSAEVRNYPLVALILDTLTELHDVEVGTVGFTSQRGVAEDAARWGNERHHLLEPRPNADDVVKWASQDPEGVVVVFRKDVWDQNDVVSAANRRGLTSYVYDVPMEQREKTVQDGPLPPPLATEPEVTAEEPPQDAEAFWDRVESQSKKDKVVNDAFSRWDEIDPSLDQWSQRDRLSGKGPHNGRTWR